MLDLLAFCLYQHQSLLHGPPLISTVASLATERLLALPEYQSARRVSIYLSMPAGEMMTRDIVRDAFRRGKQVFVPYIYKHGGSAETKPSSIMEMLALRSIEDYESLQPDGWGIPTLDASSVADRENCLGGNGLRGEDGALKEDSCGLDFIVVPGMAFDDGRRRLGHGKGYYDRFINRYRSNVGEGQMPYLGEIKQHIVSTAHHSVRHTNPSLIYSRFLSGRAGPSASSRGACGRV